MSRENVEVVRQIYEASARGDTATVLTLYDTAVEFDASSSAAAELLRDQVYRGHEGLRRIEREWREAFENVETDCEELIDAGSHVVSISRYRMRGRASGIEVTGPPQAGVWTIREDRVVRVVWFNTRKEALEAAGLSE